MVGLEAGARPGCVPCLPAASLESGWRSPDEGAPCPLGGGGGPGGPPGRRGGRQGCPEGAEGLDGFAGLGALQTLHVGVFPGLLM